MAKTANTATRSPFSFVSGNVATKADFQTVHEMQNAARTLPVNLWTVQGTISSSSAYSPAGASGVTFPASGSVEVYRAEIYIDPDLQTLDIKTTATLPAAATGTATVAIGSLSVANAHTAGATTTVSASLATSATGTGWQLATITLAQTTGNPSTGTLDRARVRSGTLAATALPSPSGYEDSGQYAIFDGVSDYVEYAGVGDLWGDSAFTLSGWIYQSSIDSGVIFQADDAGAMPVTVPAYLRIETLSSNVRFQYYDGSAKLWTSNSAPIAGLNQWHHVAATFNAGTVALYVNGAAVTASGATFPSSIRAAVGAVQVSINAAVGLAGRIKHAAYWSGTAASAAQVLEIYNAGTPPNLASLATLAAPTWWVTCAGTFSPELGAGTPVTVGSPTFGGP